MNIYNFYFEHIYPQLYGIIYLDTPVDEYIKKITKRNGCEEWNVQ